MIRIRRMTTRQFCVDLTAEEDEETSTYVVTAAVIFGGAVIGEDYLYGCDYDDIRQFDKGSQRDLVAYAIEEARDFLAAAADCHSVAQMRRSRTGGRVETLGNRAGIRIADTL